MEDIVFGIMFSHKLLHLTTREIYSVDKYF